MNAQTNPPEIPHQFYGFVTIANQSAPANTIITAQIGSKNSTVFTKYDGTYGCCNSLCTPDICPSDVFYVSRNDTNTSVLFYVSDVNIVNTSFQMGGYTFLNLSWPTDIFPPSIFNFGPNGTITTNSTTLTASTNEIARCRIGATPNVPYDNMPSASTTALSTIHAWNVDELTSGNYVYYVRCVDQVGNKNPTDAIINFIVSLSESEGVSTELTPPFITPTQICKEDWINVSNQSLYLQRCILPGNTSVFSLFLEHNGDRILNNLEFKEKLPTEVASKENELKISLKPERFEQGSLILVWVFEKLSPKESIRLNYSVNKMLSAPILEKFTISEIKEIGLVEVLNPILVTQCTKDEDCPDDEYCKNQICLPVRGICGYVSNHRWIKYECCEDADCEVNEKCEEHKCVQKPISMVRCGDGKCEGNETCESCHQDCGKCQILPLPSPKTPAFDFKLLLIIFIGIVILLCIIIGGFLYLSMKKEKK